MTTPANVTPLGSDVSADTAHLELDKESALSRESHSENFDIYTTSGVAKPANFEDIASDNSAALRELMKNS